MTLEEYNEKIAQLKAEGKKLAQENNIEGAEKTKAEIEKITAQFEADKTKVAEENALLNNQVIPDLMKNEVKIGEENNNMEKIYNAESTEYKNAFLKKMLGRDLTELENAAYTQTTQNAPAVIPTEIANEIWDLVTGQHAILGDVNVYRTGTILEIVKHTEVKQGKAKKVTEGKGNDDTQNTLVNVTLSGNDFSKTVKISRAALKMSISAFEDYITSEIAAELGEAMSEDLVTKVETDVNTVNQLAATKQLAYADVLKAFGSLKRAKNKVVYATSEFIYTQIAALKDDAGRFVFQPSAVPGVAGTLLGATIKEEDAVATNKMLVGDPKRIAYNMIEDVNVTRQNAIDAPQVVFLGYARGEGALVDDKSFAEVTVNPA